MKIFLLFALLIVSKTAGEFCSEQIYIAKSYLTYYMRAAHSTQNKPAILQQLDHSLYEIESTVNKLEGLQRKYRRFEGRYGKFYYATRQFFPLVNLLKPVLRIRLWAEILFCFQPPSVRF